MEIVTDDEEEVGIILTHREFRILMELYGEATPIPDLKNAWEIFDDWRVGYDYEYIVSKASKGPYDFIIR